MALLQARADLRACGFVFGPLLAALCALLAWLAAQGLWSFVTAAALSVVLVSVLALWMAAAFRVRLRRLLAQHAEQQTAQPGEVAA